jgi:hypothetical protein
MGGGHTGGRTHSVPAAFMTSGAAQTICGKQPTPGANLIPAGQTHAVGDDLTIDGKRQAQAPPSRLAVSGLQIGATIPAAGVGTVNTPQSPHEYHCDTGEFVL